MNILTDNWSESGHSYSAFKKLCMELSYCYDYIKVVGSEIALLSVKPMETLLAEFDAVEKTCVRTLTNGIPLKTTLSDAFMLLSGKTLRTLEKDGRISLLEETISEDEKTIRVNYLTRGRPISTDPNSGTNFLPSTRVNKSDTDEFKLLCKETLRPYSLMLLIDKKIYFTSGGFLSTFKQRAKLSGLAVAEPSLERNALLAKCLPDETYTLIYLSYGPYRKAMALCSEDYTALPVSEYLRFISDLGNDSILGKVKFLSYQFSHQKKDVFLSFPDYAKELSEKYGTPSELIPGLLIRTSDTGSSSFEVSGIWYYKGTYFKQKSVPPRMHKSDLTLDGLLGEVENDIYLCFEKVPQRLSELKKISGFAEGNNLWKKVFAGICDERIAGKKVLGRIIERLSTKVFPTLMDAALSAVAISLKEENNAPAQEELRKSVVKIIFSDVLSKGKE